MGAAILTPEVRSTIEVETHGQRVAVCGGGPAPSSTRWAQLAVGIVGMVAIANLQYGWTLFVNPIDSKFH